MLEDIGCLASELIARRMKGKSLSELQIWARKRLGRPVPRDEIRAVLEEK